MHLLGKNLYNGHILFIMDFWQVVGVVMVGGEMYRKKEGYHHKDLKASLVAAAREHLEESGVESLSLREVSRRLGVSHAASYRHFKDKAALLAEVAIVGFVEIHKLLHETITRKRRDK